MATIHKDDTIIETYTVVTAGGCLDSMGVPRQLVTPELITDELKRPDSNLKKEVSHSLAEMGRAQYIADMQQYVDNLRQGLLAELRALVGKEDKSEQRLASSTRSIEPAYHAESENFVEKANVNHRANDLAQKMAQFDRCDKELQALTNQQIAQVEKSHQECKPVLEQRYQTYQDILLERMAKLPADRQQPAKDMLEDFKEQWERANADEANKLKAAQKAPDPVVRMQLLQGINMRRELLLAAYLRQAMGLELITAGEQKSFRQQLWNELTFHQEPGQKEPVSRHKSWSEILEKRETKVVEMRTLTEQMSKLEHELKAELGTAIASPLAPPVAVPTSVAIATPTATETASPQPKP